MPRWARTGSSPFASICVRRSRRSMSPAAEAVSRLDRAFAAIDAANAEDPNTVEIDGERRPKEQVHAELMTEWVRRLDPSASEEQLIAARAHHLRRWALPRESEPRDRAGYLRWRAALRRRHAEDVAAVQVHEDALCLVFLQTQLDELAGKEGHDKMIEILRKTATKMSPAGLAAAGGLTYSPEGAALLGEALDG